MFTTEITITLLTTTQYDYTKTSCFAVEQKTQIYNLAQLTAEWGDSKLTAVVEMLTESFFKLAQIAKNISPTY